MSLSFAGASQADPLGFLQPQLLSVGRTGDLLPPLEKEVSQQLDRTGHLTQGWTRTER